MNTDTTSLCTQLMSSHLEDIMNYIERIHPYPSDTDDIAQNTAIKIYKNFRKYDPHRPFLPWAFRFASFEVLKFRRSKARCRLYFTDKNFDVIEEPDTNFHKNTEVQFQSLEQQINKLKEEDIQLIRYRYENGKSIKEMADKLEVSPRILYKKLERLRGKLKQNILSKPMVAE